MEVRLVPMDESESRNDPNSQEVLQALDFALTAIYRGDRPDVQMATCFERIRSRNQTTHALVSFGLIESGEEEHVVTVDPDGGWIWLIPLEDFRHARSYIFNH